MNFIKTTALAEDSDGPSHTDTDATMTHRHLHHHQNQNRDPHSNDWHRRQANASNRQLQQGRFVAPVPNTSHSSSSVSSKSSGNITDSAVGFLKSQFAAMTDNFFGDSSVATDHSYDIEAPPQTSGAMANNTTVIDHDHFDNTENLRTPHHRIILQMEQTDVAEQHINEHWLLPGERILRKVDNIGYLRTSLETAEGMMEADSADRGETGEGMMVHDDDDDDDENGYYDEDDEDDVSGVDTYSSDHQEKRRPPFPRPSLPQMLFRSHHRDEDSVEIEVDENDDISEFDVNNIDAIESRNRKLNRFFKLKQRRNRKKNRRSGGSNLTVQINDIHGDSRSIPANDAHGVEYRHILVGSLYITNYQVRFIHRSKADSPTDVHSSKQDTGFSATQQQQQQQQQLLQLDCGRDPSIVFVASAPLCTILKVEERKYPQSDPNNSNSVFNGCIGHVSIRCKDFQIIDLLLYQFTSESSILHQIDHIYYPQSVSRIFAFEFGKMTFALRDMQNDTGSSSSSSPLSSGDGLAGTMRTTKTIEHICSKFTEEQVRRGWDILDTKEEFMRQKVVNTDGLGQHWRISHVNKGFRICETYPKLLVVPRTISDAKLYQSSTFRSKGRIPALTWCHPSGNSCIMRSSQPMVGIGGSRCTEDEELMEGVLRTTRSGTLYIIDARPKANAMVNTVMGKGYENTRYYTGSVIEFLNIDNIHTMTRSLNILRNLCQKPTDLYWLSNMESSGWLKHLRQLITGANRIVDIVHKKKCPVLVHCSDGWDRTSQLCALAQLLLDPYYRTIHGFQVLIEKDWINFGFKFQDRCGHLTKGNSSEFSPIFMQWIDCVWQIWQQYPSAFEFNEVFLITLMDHVYSGLFGNFLHNSEREREGHHIRQTTISLWTYINSDMDKYYNSFYKDPSKRNSVIKRRSTDSSPLVATPSETDSQHRNNDITAPPSSSSSSSSLSSKTDPSGTDTSMIPQPHILQSVQVIVPDASIATLAANFWVNYYFRYKMGVKSKQSLLKKLKRENSIIKQSLQKEKAKRARLEKEYAMISRRMYEYQRYFEQKGIPLALSQEQSDNLNLCTAGFENLVVIRQAPLSSHQLDGNDIGGSDSSEDEQEQQVAVCSTFVTDNTAMMRHSSSTQHSDDNRPIDVQILENLNLTEDYFT